MLFSQAAGVGRLPWCMTGLGFVCLALITACSYDHTLSSVECEEEGARSDQRICIDGYWVAADEPDVSTAHDTGPDPPSDTASDTAPDTAFDTCISPDDDEMCEQEQRYCGTLQIEDRCDQMRTIDCGSCGLDKTCADGNCVAYQCENSPRQTDTDCGGPHCPRCEAGQNCGDGGDCQSGVCTNGSCAPPSRDDGVQNGEETDVDCGGPDCPGCEAGQSCDHGGDCQSGVCNDGSCEPPSCDDGVQNGEETDVDCGGPDCPPCDGGLQCVGDEDCVSKVCAVERSGDGLVSLYTFDDGSGVWATDQQSDYVATANALGALVVYGQHYDDEDDAILDRSGNDHHGTLEGGAQWLDADGPTDDLSGHLHHDASQNSFTEMAHHEDFNLTGNHTIAYWRRLHDDDPTGHATDFAKGNDTYQARTSEADELHYTLRDQWPDPNDEHNITTDELQVDTWQFLVFVYDQDAGLVEIYVDDMESPSASGVHSADVGTNEVPITLAAWNSATAGDSGSMGRYADVDFAGFSVFDRALDESQRRQLMDGAMNLELSGDVDWNNGSIDLDGGMLRHDDPARWYSAILNGFPSFSVEVWVQAASDDQDGPARIVSLSEDTQNRNFTLGADDDRIIVRIRHADASDNGIPYTLDVANAVTLDLAHYVFTFDEGDVQLYRDGALLAADTVSEDLSDWDRSYPLLLGNEGTDDRAWKGQMHLAAFYDRVLEPPEIADHFATGSDVSMADNICAAPASYTGQ